MLRKTHPHKDQVQRLIPISYSLGVVLRKGDATNDAFFDQLSVVWRQIDTFGP
jgi:hypothetical protein